MAEKTENRINTVVITPYKCFLEERVSSVVLPTIDGEIGVMHGHSPLVVALTPGICSIRVGDKKRYFSVSEGYAEIGQNIVVIVCDSAEWPEDISVKQIAESLKAAEEDKKHLLSIEENKARKYVFREVEQRLMRVKARIKLVQLYGTDLQRERLVSHGLVKNDK